MTDISTDLEAEVESGRPRRRGGRATGERSRLPPQRPWAQPRMRYKPTEVVSEDELESIHEASLRILEEIGMDFLDAEARDRLAAAGARV
ncbi:MAG: trimethylamine methyltransferase family protein, partial [Chloroflexi bacterium]|nr:trimethylamine methyltransferase family protein [Chloroflexota bacterium]